MKANSAFDPYWRAKVREETAVNPNAAAIIEDTCLRCHAPAQQYPKRTKNARLRMSDLDNVGEEGVTCSLCHQITSEGLGTEKSFTAGFTIGSDDRIYGPHRNPFSMPMLHHTGYQPTESKHMLDSALCGSCHTVITPTLDTKGKIVGRFIEQAPYLEWMASDFAKEERSCQSCHMPQLAAPSYIAHRPPGGPFPPTSPRTPYGQHSFAGANVRGPEMLAELLPDRATSLAASSSRNQDSLSNALRLELAASPLAARLALTVRVTNLTGHKLPTAYPSRRLWLHLTATDSQGQTVFESGEFDPATSELRASARQPHQTRITSSGQVMVYEAEHGDMAGSPTNSLLRAANYLKDNRLLPRGFRADIKLPGSPGSIAPVGTEGDSDFIAGSDQVIYELPAITSTVTVEALYQSIKPEHARETASFANPDANRFGHLFERHRSPVIVARALLKTGR